MSVPFLIPTAHASPALPFSSFTSCLPIDEVYRPTLRPVHCNVAYTVGIHFSRSIRVIRLKIEVSTSIKACYRPSVSSVYFEGQSLSGRRSSEKVGRWVRIGEVWGARLRLPTPVLEVRCVILGKFFKNIDANLCDLVHFGDIMSSKVGRKIDAFPSQWDGIYRPCHTGSAPTAALVLRRGYS